MSTYRVVLMSAVAVFLAMSSLSGANAKHKCHSPNCETASARQAVSRPFGSLIEFFKDPTAGMRKSANGVVDHAAHEGQKLLKKAETTGNELVDRAKREADSFSEAVEKKVDQALEK